MSAAGEFVATVDRRRRQNAGNRFFGPVDRHLLGIAETGDPGGAADAAAPSATCGVYLTGRSLGPSNKYTFTVRSDPCRQRRTDQHATITCSM